MTLAPHRNGQNFSR